MLEIWGEFILLKKTTEKTHKFSKNAYKKIGKTHGSRDAVWKTAKRRENECTAEDWQW